MNVDLIQVLYYAGFAMLGWWLRHRGWMKPTTPSGDPKELTEVLKMLLDRLAQPANSTSTKTPNGNAGA